MFKAVITKAGVFASQSNDGNKLLGSKSGWCAGTGFIGKKVFQGHYQFGPILVGQLDFKLFELRVKLSPAVTPKPGSVNVKKKLASELGVIEAVEHSQDKLAAAD
jgi:hypothetical protein